MYRFRSKGEMAADVSAWLAGLTLGGGPLVLEVKSWTGTTEADFLELVKRQVKRPAAVVAVGECNYDDPSPNLRRTELGIYLVGGAASGLVGEREIVAVAETVIQALLPATERPGDRVVISGVDYQVKEDRPVFTKLAGVEIWAVVVEATDHRQAR